jgi:fluoroacetyl-CoA thioesterase
VPSFGSDDADSDEALAAYRAKERPAALAGGRTASVDVEVTGDLTAERVGSGDLPVLASPSIVRLVEQAAVAMLRGRLPRQLTTVGSSFELAHVAPTPAGGTVRLEVRLEPGSGRSLTFRFAAYDGAGEVARGSHLRVIVERDPFLARAEARRRT